MAAYRARYSDEEKPVPRNDAYTGLLAISLFAMLVGCLLLGLDLMSYDGSAPPRVKNQLAPLKGDGRQAEPPKVEKPELRKEQAKPEEAKKEEAPKKADKQDEKKEDSK